MTTSSEPTATVQCLKMEYKSNLEIEIRVNETTTTTVTCSGEESKSVVYLGDLDCTKSYNLSAVWVSTINFYEECLLSEISAVTFACPGIATNNIL